MFETNKNGNTTYQNLRDVAKGVLRGKFIATNTYIKKLEGSVIKRNEIELFVVRWMDLESVIQSEVSQKEKNEYRMLTHIYGI